MREQLTALKAWAMGTLPASTRAIGHDIRTTFGVSYTRSGLLELMAALDFVWRQPDLVPSHLDFAAQRDFVEQQEDFRNGFGADEAIVYGDAVHPACQTRPAGVWMPRGADVAGPCGAGP